MNTDKLQQIVARKNEQLEQEAVREVQHTIDQIAKWQQDIVMLQGLIKEAQTGLRELTIPQLDSVKILG